MDIEGFVRRRLEEGRKSSEVARELAGAIVEFKDWSWDRRLDFAKEVVSEVEKASGYGRKGDFVERLLSYPRAGVGMGKFGVGSRGEGDFFVHGKLAELIGDTGAEIDPREQDDAGVVKAGDSYIAVAIDGMHSRLSDYPFLAGFHAARAALRDICVMGCRPVATASDLHLGDDGDIGKLLDYTAGVSLAGELCSAPLVAGSTLRIGGDMVFGSRLVGGVGAVGVSRTMPKARRMAKEGDAILVAQGSGGGTVSTIAIYHGFHRVAGKTLNLEFVQVCSKLMQSELWEKVHALSDITNGGLRGDAKEIARVSGKRLVFYEEKLEKTVSPEVLRMLQELEIDYLGISTDALMIVAAQACKAEILKTLEGVANVYEVGRVEEGDGAYIEKQGELREFKPLFREAAYTRVKELIGESYPEDYEEMRAGIEEAGRIAIEKKLEVKNFILRRSKDGKGNL